MRRGQQQRIQELERRLQTRFGESIRTRLGLDAEKLRAVQGVMQTFQAERQTLNRAQTSLRYRLRDPALASLSDEAARALLQETLSLQERELDLYRREQARLLEVLTPPQLVLFYSLRDELGQRIQQLRLGGGGAGVLGDAPVGGLGGGAPPLGLLPEGEPPR
jgi:hypothetical protein